eukprot:TRINITY_DN73622_c0_g1_i1.p1 TRINITY_DN73622_c0_g1~~TRINITY_DN73622_c0_g1_i1.p1  ORF type:complete len:280 (+),score=40.38 TRINITY_DN73622_c0_g1_i1:62-841(+)
MDGLRSATFALTRLYVCASIATLVSCDTVAADKTAAVIWLHGLGDSDQNWRRVFRDAFKGKPSMRHVAWNFPVAPKRPITMSDGAVMPGWFDILAVDADAGEDVAGITDAVGQVEKVIDGLLSRNPSLRRDRIVVGGFSQGGSLALASLLGGNGRLAGVAVVSGWLSERERLNERVSGDTLDRRNVPIFWAHGTKDPIVYEAWGKQSVRFLREAGFDVTWNSYNVAHEISPQVLKDLGSFLQDVLPQNADGSMPTEAEL